MSFTNFTTAQPIHGEIHENYLKGRNYISRIAISLEEGWKKELLSCVMISDNAMTTHGFAVTTQVSGTRTVQVAYAGESLAMATLKYNELKEAIKQ